MSVCVVCLCVSLSAGVVGGLLWLLLWRLIGRPQVSMVLAGLCLGYVVSCVVYLITPLSKSANVVVVIQSKCHVVSCFQLDL